MKFLLCAVNTKYIHSNPAVYLLKAYFLQEEGACGKECGHEIGIREFTINNYTEDVLFEICRERPDVVLFSCYIWNRTFICSLFGDLKKVLPHMDIWLGGPEVSFHPEQVLREFPEVKGILIGEGEAVFRDLVLSYPDRISRVPGICLRDREMIVNTGPRPLLSMDEVPFLYRYFPLSGFSNKILYYESSRGCPYSCSYCLSSVDKTVRLRSLEKVYGELQFFLDQKVPQVKFVDRTFNVDHRHTLGIWNYIREHDNGITNFHFELAGDLLTEEELKAMAGMRPGLIQLEIGVQSVNPDTLAAIHRKMNPEKLKTAVAAVHSRRNIHQHLDLIAGLPFEDYASFARSFNAVYAMEPSQLQLGFLKVLKGSPMEQCTQQNGIVYSQNPPYDVLYTNWLSYEELHRLKRIEEMVELYYNSGQFTRTIRVLQTQFGSAFEMYEALADYYEEQGLFVQTPSRLYRYEVLLDFAVKQAPQEVLLYRELLTFDLYYREHLKSRPDFAPDLAPYKEQIRAFRTDRSMHVDVFFYPVLETDASRLSQRREVPSLYIFDYSRRDPLDHNAFVSELP